jgi:hypothetical protein
MVGASGLSGSLISETAYPARGELADDHSLGDLGGLANHGVPVHVQHAADRRSRPHVGWHDREQSQVAGLASIFYGQRREGAGPGRARPASASIRASCSKSCAFLATATAASARTGAGAPFTAPRSTVQP